MNLAISQDFLTSLALVPGSVAKKVREAISKFRVSPTAGGLNYERVQGARDKHLRSIRIDLDYRMILWASPEGGNHVLLWIDRHDAAYAWSRNRRVEINPEIGALQVYEVAGEEAAGTSGAGGGTAGAPRDGAGSARPGGAPGAMTEAEAAQAAATGLATGSASGAPGLFDSLRDRELMRLGVPEELIPLARSIRSDEDLEAVEGRFPPLAFQGLYLVAAGESYEAAVNALERPEPKTLTAEDEGLLASPESRASFFLVEDDQILEEMFNAPLERWRVFLHPSQRRLVERDWNGPVKVTGGPGTGKTVVALHRARWLAENLVRDGADKNPGHPMPARPILFTTFTRNLAQDISSLLERICSTDAFRLVEVQNIDAVARDVLRKHHFDQTVVFEGRPEIEELWEEALAEAASDDLPRAFYREEWRQVIQPQQIRDLEAYKAASRVGRKIRLKRPQLLSAWPVFEAYLALLDRHRWIESQDAFFAAAKFLEGSTPLYQSVIVDETQDMGTPALVFLRALVAPGKNDLFLAGDAHQAIYTRRTALSKAGIAVQGRSRRLLLNYRTTKQIGQWATRWIEGADIDDLDGSPETLKGYRSLVSGQPPVDLRQSVPEEKLARIRLVLQALSAADRASTCIAVPTRDLVHEWKGRLDAWGIPAMLLEGEIRSSPGEVRSPSGEVRPSPGDSRLPPGEPAVSIATIHRIKGLEFDRVLVHLPPDGMPNDRALGFVAATRARKELVIF